MIAYHRSTQASCCEALSHSQCFCSAIESVETHGPAKKQTDVVD